MSVFSLEILYPLSAISTQQYIPSEVGGRVKEDAVLPMEFHKLCTKYIVLYYVLYMY